MFNAFIGYFQNPVLRRLLERKATELNRNLVSKYEQFLRDPEGNGWYHAGTEPTCAMLEECGYQVVERDVGADPRSPIIHFVR